MSSRTLALTVVALTMNVLVNPLQERVSAQSGTGIVISEYRFRGPAGANDEFIELFNASTAPVNVSGWLLRASNNNVPPGIVTRLTIAANTVINPGCFFLAVNTAAGGYSGSVVGNQTYTVGFGDDGGLALTTASVATIVDQVGQGTVAAAFGEGTRLPAVTTNINRGIERRPGGTQGHVDTNNNRNDFQEITPANPQSGSSACLVPGSMAITTTVSPASVEQGGLLSVFGRVFPGTVPPSSGVQVSGDLTAVGGSATTTMFDDGVSPDLLANDSIFTTSVPVPANNPLGARSITLTTTDAQGRTASNSANADVIAPARIYLPHEVQGAGAVSPMATGTSVTVRGVVTARKSDGFFIQTEPGQEDTGADTSEGLFVFVSSGAPATAQVGRVVNVTGAVAEFVPATDPASPSFTQLTAVVAVNDVGEGLTPPAYELTSSDVSDAGALDQLERFEGMRVSAASLTAVSGTGGNRDEAHASSTSDGAFYAVLTGQARPLREPGVEVGSPVLGCAIGPCTVPVFDGNPERLRVDSDALEGMAAVDVSTGAVMTGVSGPLDYSVRAYTILPETPLAPLGGTTLLAAPAPAFDQFTIATVNLDRFYDAVDDAGADTVLTAAAYDLRLAKASLTIRNVLNTPDVVAVQEVEHLGALFALANRIDSDAAAAGQTLPQYIPFLLEGNDARGLDVGFLVKQTGGRVTMLSVEQIGNDVMFSDPADGSQLHVNDHPPVVLLAMVVGPSTTLPQNLTVIVNHLTEANDAGLDTPAGQRVRRQRQLQAEFLADYIQERQSNDPSEAIVSVGDYNAFSFNDGHVDVVGTVRGVPAATDQVA
ncbi:MAG: lamin tail domain-containing protein, partial [Vicinamibacterales bacterium]